MKKLSILLALLITFTISTTVFAENSPKTDKDYKVVESHKQITDKDELVQLAIHQRSDAQLNKSFNSKQLLEKRVYDDGTIEENLVASSVAVVEDNMQQIDASNVIAATATTYYYQNGTKSTTKSNGSVSVLQTIFYTIRYTDPTGIGGVEHKVNKVETIIPSSSSSCTSLLHGYHILHDSIDDHYSTVINNPTGQLYTLSGTAGYYSLVGGVWNSIYSYFHITLNNGSILEGTINLAA